MNADLLVVVLRDIARAEREGRCDADYMASAAELLRIAASEPRPVLVANEP